MDIRIDRSFFRECASCESGEFPLPYFKINAGEFIAESFAWEDEIAEKSKNEDEMSKARVQELMGLQIIKDMALLDLTDAEKDAVMTYYKPTTDSDERSDGIEEVMDNHKFATRQKFYDVLRSGCWELSQSLATYEENNELRRFYYFDIHYFLKNASTWGKRISELNKEVQFEIGIKAKPLDGIGGGRKNYNTESPVVADVISTEERTTELKKYETYIWVLADAIENIKPPDRILDTDSEETREKKEEERLRKTLLWQDAIYTMFIPSSEQEKHLYKAKRIENLASIHKRSITVVERELNKAKKALKAYIERNYFGIYGH